MVELALALHLSLDPGLVRPAPAGLPRLAGARALALAGPDERLGEGPLASRPLLVAPLQPPPLTAGRYAGAFLAALGATAVADALTVGCLTVLTLGDAQPDGDAGLLLLSLLVAAPGWGAAEAAGWALERDPDPAFWPAVGTHLAASLLAWQVAAASGMTFEEGLLTFTAIQLVAVPLVAVLVTAEAPPRAVAAAVRRPRSGGSTGSPRLAALPVADPARRR